MSKAEGALAGGAVVGVALASGALRGARLALVHGSLVESVGAVEGTDTTDHDVGASIVTGTVEEDFTFRTGCAGSVAAKTSLAVVGAVLAGTVDGIGADGTDIQTFEEHKGPVKGKKIAWFGDGNNVAVSFIHAAVLFDVYV